jgi:hypothetical protein
MIGGSQLNTDNTPYIKWITGFFFLIVSAVSQAVILVETGDPGFYNNSIGTVLNLSNTGIDDANEPFPVNDDSIASYPASPSLFTARSILGDWLTNSQNLNSNWSSSPITIPNSWTVETEVAVIYQFDTLGATNVVARFGVDNGIFVWFDGEYKFGARGPGSYHLGEYEINLGNLEAGRHYLQLLLEDHGTTNGYAVEISADEFIPAPNIELGEIQDISTRYWDEFDHKFYTVEALVPGWESEIDITIVNRGFSSIAAKLVYGLSVNNGPIKKIDGYTQLNLPADGVFHVYHTTLTTPVDTPDAKTLKGNLVTVITDSNNDVLDTSQKVVEILYPELTAAFILMIMYYLSL